MAIMEVPEYKVLADKVKNIEDDEKLNEAIKDWFEKIRTQGMKLGAQMICVAVTDVMNKHLSKRTKPSLRDYERMSTEIAKLISVPLKQKATVQNNSEAETAANSSGEDNGEESSI